MCLALIFFTVWGFCYVEVIGKIVVRKYKYLRKGKKFIQGILRTQAWNHIVFRRNTKYSVT